MNTEEECDEETTTPCQKLLQRLTKKQNEPEMNHSEKATETIQVSEIHSINL